METDNEKGLIAIIKYKNEQLDILTQEVSIWKKLAENKYNEIQSSSIKLEIEKTKELFEDPYIKQIGMWKHVQRLEEENEYLNKQVSYAKEQYTLTCMGEKSAGLSEFELTLDALQNGADPETYINEVVNEISKK